MEGIHNFVELFMNDNIVKRTINKEYFCFIITSGYSESFYVMQTFYLFAGDNYIG